MKPPSRRDDVGIILGEICVLLINSSIAGSIMLFVELRMYITDLIICMNKFTFHYVNDVY